ncbi:putative lipid II flippase FtsW [Temperatibacter marinus]|uniref:Probable peptidoglycan glycosyltransferase FtsW n=1 Tax=Temperatibacter marinus TaxID=1456591 RepID=A0AA52EEG9_9PROT|nr:putative lipid II flippase FtsW [Temperatibacter marinus]WND01593.1 putative lipid II flippase FtsW [Temperatibacter marinus]
MISFSRADNSVVSRWWFEVDRWILVLILMLSGIGVWLTFSASTSVAENIGFTSFHFATRQIVFLSLGLLVTIIVSMMSVKMIRRLAIIALPLCIGLIVITLLIGPEIKGSTRWLRVAGFSLQPSEFLKPVFFICTAWLLSSKFTDQAMPAKRLATFLYLTVAALLIMQPDFGQTFLIGLVFLGQLIIAGLSLAWVATAALAGISALVIGYIFVPHVTKRIDKFVDPTSGDNYQTHRALEAFKEGGLIGKGPGEGTVKMNLPDAHTDYIFAVMGEEFGALACIVLLLLISGIVLRVFAHLRQEEDPFKMLALSGLVMQFALQSSINIAVNLNLIPSKGMTLPFVSYGGSSMLALAAGMGVILAFSRRNRHLTVQEEKRGWGRQTYQLDRGY